MRLHTQTFRVGDTVVYVDLWQWRTDKVKVRLSVRYADGDEKRNLSYAIETPGLIRIRSEYKRYLLMLTATEHDNRLIRNAQKALREIL